MNLGYDPQPEVRTWRGTPIPPVADPLARSERRWRIAERVWWHGPPWTVLRNSAQYLWNVMDWGEDDDIAFTRRDVPRRNWVRALETAQPGNLSKGSYVLWSLVFDLQPIGFVCDWPQAAHVLDCRPLAGATREQLYERQRRRTG